MSIGYFIIKSGEDGTRVDGPFTEKQVLDRITPNKDGETYYGSGLVFLDSIPESDKGCWAVASECIVIIKGQIINPKPVSQVTKYEL